MTTIHDETLIASTAHIARRPIHPMLVPVPIVCFVGALITDIMYLVTAEMMWADFSAWLITPLPVAGRQHRAARAFCAPTAGMLDY